MSVSHNALIIHSVASLLGAPITTVLHEEEALFVTEEDYGHM